MVTYGDNIVGVLLRGFSSVPTEIPVPHSKTTAVR